MAQPAFLGSTSTLASDACGPECMGTCVAGMCDMEGVPLPGLRQPRPLGLDALPSSTEQSSAVTGLSMSPDAHASSGYATSVRGQFATLAPHRTASFDQQFQDELRQVNANSARLHLENNDLSHELRAWQTISVHITADQVQAQTLLGRSGTLSGLELGARPTSYGSNSTWASLIDIPFASRTAHGLLTGLPLVHFWRYMFVCVFFVMLAFTLGSQRRKAKLNGANNVIERRLSASIWWDWRTALTDAVTRGGQRQVFLPMLRSWGIAHHMIEISQIHLGNLLASGDVYATLRTPQGHDLRTLVAPHSDGSFYSFKEAFIVSVRKSDHPYALQVFDSQGELASLELPAWKLVSLAMRPCKQEYFRTEFHTKAVDTLEAVNQKPANASGDASPKPYAAMRIRVVASYAGPTSAM